MYQAIVSSLKNVREHPNADRLKLADIRGVQVVVGLNAQEGDLGIFFPEDGRLSTDFCEHNDLYPRFDEEGKRIGGGFFDRKNSRVRSQKFRGEASTGYFAALSSVDYTGVDPNLLTEGFRFSELNGHRICEKYYTPATLKAMSNAAAAQRRATSMFPKHVDSLRYQYEADMVYREGNIITITEKLHGTSHRQSLSLYDVEKPKRRTFRDRFFNRLPETETTKEWTHLIGSRNVVLGESSGMGFYGTNDFRYQVAERISDYLQPGEVVYGEIVGWATESVRVMGAQEIGEDLKELRKYYGSSMCYNYGCAQGETGFHVYRIVKMDDDANPIELSWPQVKRRCAELGVEHVPELLPPFMWSDNFDRQAFEQILADELVEGPSVIDPSHIREGVVLRVDRPDGTTVFVKNKSWTFGRLEGYIKDSENYVDLEEIS